MKNWRSPLRVPVLRCFSCQRPPELCCCSQNPPKPSGSIRFPPSALWCQWARHYFILGQGLGVWLTKLWPPHRPWFKTSTYLYIFSKQRNYQSLALSHTILFINHHLLIIDFLLFLLILQSFYQQGLCSFPGLDLLCISWLLQHPPNAINLRYIFPEYT